MMCTMQDACFSFNYNLITGECFMSSLNLASTPNLLDVPVNPNFNFFQRTRETCFNGGLV